MSISLEEMKADPRGAEVIKILNQETIYDFSARSLALPEELKKGISSILWTMVSDKFSVYADQDRTEKILKLTTYEELEIELSKMREEANDLIDLTEKIYLLCEASEHVSPITDQRRFLERTLDCHWGPSDPMKDVPPQRKCGTLNQDYWDMKQKVAALIPTTPVSSMIKTGLFAIVCMLAVAAIYLVPPIANFFTGNIYMTVLTVAAVILLIVLWYKKGFCLGYLMLLGIALAVGIPLVFLEHWVGAAATEQLLFALIPGAVAFFCILSIWADMRNNKTEPRLAAEYVHHLYTMLRYSETCYEHALDLGLGELAGYYKECAKDIRDLLSQLETKFPELAKSGDTE